MLEKKIISLPDTKFQPIFQKFLSQIQLDNPAASHLARDSHFLNFYSYLNNGLNNALNIPENRILGFHRTSFKNALIILRTQTFSSRLHVGVNPDMLRYFGQAVILVAKKTTETPISTRQFSDDNIQILVNKEGTFSHLSFYAVGYGNDSTVDKHSDSHEYQERDYD